MKLSVVAFLVAPLTLMVAPAAASDADSSRIEIRVETSANSEAGLVEPCEVAVQAASRSPAASWAAFGEVRPKKNGEGFGLVDATNRCGTGPPSVPPPSSATAPAPLLLIEISATPMWNPAPMDPGPVPVVEIILGLTSRQLTGFSPDGKPLYRDPVKEHRIFRVGAGEEFVVPVMVSDASITGVHEVLVRIRAGQAGPPGATEYGAIAVMAAGPGSEILLDGGVLGRAGADGSALLEGVRVGEREVRVRGPLGPAVMRIVTVVEGRTVVVSPETPDAGTPAQPAFRPAGKNAQGVPEFRRVRDGAPMVRIPEGEFMMGNIDTEGKPLPHLVSVSAFLMDKLPVTWGRFKRFAAATGRPLPPEPYWGIHDDHPVAFVRWDEGRAYCEWAGGRLPTEAEREKAARGTDGRKFPWGNEEPSPERGVFRRNWGYEGSDVVGIRPAGASPYGLLDTGGNMWEWCQDWHDPEYYKSSPRQDPTGPRTGRARVVRGGSWDSRPTVLSASCRNWGYVGYREGDFGFRCAADLPR